jgi:hypothetical protein
MNNKLYVLGGRQRKALLRDPIKEWHWYEAALILEVDVVAGSVRTCVEYKTPREVRASDNSSINFHSGALIENTLYTCTTTEVLIYRLPSFEQIGYISLPCFNDVHHVTPAPDGNLLVVTTGLDMVVKVTPQGEVLAEWSVLEEAPFTRFSRTTDYRTVETTKPHMSHPNFVFLLGDEVWVTRFNQRDAVSMSGSKKRIEIAVEKPHDGLVDDDRILFTTVDGKIIIVNRHTLRIERIVDLRSIQDHDRQVLPAWCRSILPVDERQVWVGFTRIRKTLLRENVRWVKTVLQEGTVVKPTHIALFDIVSQQCLKEIDLEPYGMNTVFGIFPANEE